MHEIIHEQVSVITIYDRNKGLVIPRKVKWQGRVYTITTIGYHHRIKEGKKLVHVFSVANSSIAMRLLFDTENLHWMLEEISDDM